MRWFDTEEAFRLIEKYKVTGFSGSPAMFAMMLNSPLADNYDLSSLRRCGCGSAPLPLDILKVSRKNSAVRFGRAMGFPKRPPS